MNMSTATVTAPDEARASDIQWGAGADAELIALGVGHRHPVDVFALADVDPSGSQRLQSTDLRLDVRDTQIEVDAGLAMLRLGTRCRITGGKARSGDNSRKYGSPKPTAVAERFGPESGQCLRIGAVDDDVDIRLQLFRHRHSLLHPSEEARWSLVRRRDVRQRFGDRYREERTKVLEQVERAVIGGDWGAEGYTTAAQADRLGGAAASSRDGDSSTSAPMRLARSLPGGLHRLRRRPRCDIPVRGLRHALSRAETEVVADHAVARRGERS